MKNKPSKKFRVVGNYVDPYTLELIRLDKIISIESEEAARKWVKRSYYRANINIVEKVK